MLFIHFLYPMISILTLDVGSSNNFLLEMYFEEHRTMHYEHFRFQKCPSSDIFLHFLLKKLHYLMISI